MIVLETERLTLRHVTLADAEFICGLLNEPSFLRFIGDKGVRSVDDARTYIRTGPMASYQQFGHGLYLVELADDGTAIGMCGLLRREALDDVDIGFAFSAEHGSKGYATEACRAVLRYGLETLGLERIVAITSPDNASSIRVLEKLGLAYQRDVMLPGDAATVKLFG